MPQRKHDQAELRGIYDQLLEDTWANLEKSLGFHAELLDSEPRNIHPHDETPETQRQSMASRASAGDWPVTYSMHAEQHCCCL